MFFEEALVDGILCRRTTPDGEWSPYTLAQLSERVLRLEREKVELESEADSLARQLVYGERR